MQQHDSRAGKHGWLASVRCVVRLRVGLTTATAANASSATSTTSTSLFMMKGGGMRLWEDTHTRESNTAAEGNSGPETTIRGLRRFFTVLAARTPAVMKSRSKGML